MKCHIRCFKIYDTPSICYRDGVQMSIHVCMYICLLALLDTLLLTALLMRPCCALCISSVCLCLSIDTQLVEEKEKRHRKNSSKVGTSVWVAPIRRCMAQQIF